MWIFSKTREIFVLCYHVCVVNLDIGGLAVNSITGISPLIILKASSLLDRSAV